MSLSLPFALKNLKIFTKVLVPRRLYRRDVLHRKAVRVFNVPTEQTSLSVADNIPKAPITRERLDSETGIILPQYEKLEVNDQRFSKTLTILKSRKLRESTGKMLLEGKRLINDAIAAGMELQSLYFSREKDLAAINFKNQQKVEIFKVLYRTLQVWTDLTTCPGVMGVFSRPTTEKIHILSEPTIPVTLICDNIRDPGNLGSLIRNAAAAGCQHMLLMKGCADPWETKVLRTGCGGHFRIPIINNIEWTHINTYIPKNSTIFIADNSADIEGNTMGPDFIDYNEAPEEDVEEKRYVGLNEHNQSVVIDETFDEPSELQKYEEVHLPCYLYSGIKYPKEGIILYIGGETHGVDTRITKLACEYGGRKVKIPLENCMDSLNSSFAMTIILYEIKRQLSEVYVTK